MAVCWIQGIVNNHPTHILRLRCLDQGRHPKIQGKTYGADDWFTLGAKQKVESAQIDDFAIPWNNEKAQRLILEWGPAGGKMTTLQVDITSQKLWDWVRLRDGDGKAVHELEVGSLGNAPGINHSGWTIYIGEGGELRFENEYRQGAVRDDLVSAVSAINGDAILSVVKKAREIVVEVRGTVKELTGTVNDVITDGPKAVLGVMKEGVGVASALAGGLPTSNAGAMAGGSDVAPGFAGVLSTTPEAK